VTNAKFAENIQLCLDANFAIKKSVFCLMLNLDVVAVKQTFPDGDPENGKQ
jgi:hypothetical protein